MKTKITKIGIILILLLMGSFFPVINAENTKIILNPTNSDSVERFFLIGIITDKRIEEIQMGDITVEILVFTALKVRAITTYRDIDSRIITRTTYKNVELGIVLNGLEFRGISRNHVICGVFKISESG